MTFEEKTLMIERIANEIIEYSDGAFHIEWGEEYENLTIEERQEVDAIVYDNIANCDGCGWNFIIDALEQHSDGGCYCWGCYQDNLDEEEEDE